jgi:hypothetical protein
MNLQDPQIFRSEFDRLKNSHATYLQRVEDNRKLRRNLADVDGMKAKGEVPKGATYVAIRTIDTNVSREVPTYLQYLKGSRRFCIFEPVSAPGHSANQLEIAVTNVLQYPGWEVDYIRWIDGGLLHGCDYVEVVHDKTKPGHVAVNHVGSDSLLYMRDCESIQQSPIVARAYSISSVDLDAYVKSGKFNNPVAVDKLKQHVESQQSSTSLGSLVQVYECFYKLGGIVYTVWYSCDVTETLSAPKVFMNGRCVQQVQQIVIPGTMQMTEQVSYTDIPESEYHYIPFSPSITEEKKIAQQLGHAQKAEALQNAQSVLTTAGVNGCYAASIIQWSPREDKNYAASGAAKQLDTEIAPGKIWDRPMVPWAAPYPDATLFKALDHLDTGNASANNQIAWAVNNRQDSRKTATEVQSANQASSQINSVQVLFLSIPVRLIGSRAYEIIKSQCLKGALNLGLDPSVFEVEYVIKSAGDIDYVQKQERIMSMQQDMPLVMNTGAAQAFMSDYLRERYPATAERYIQAMAQPNDGNLINALSTLLNQAVTDDTGNLRPEWQPHAQQLQQLAVQVQGRMGGMAAQGGNPTPPATPQG